MTHWFKISKFFNLLLITYPNDKQRNILPYFTILILFGLCYEIQYKVLLILYKRVISSFVKMKHDWQRSSVGASHALHLTIYWPSNPLQDNIRSDLIGPIRNQNLSWSKFLREYEIFRNIKHIINSKNIIIKMLL